MFGRQLVSGMIFGLGAGIGLCLWQLATPRRAQALPPPAQGAAAGHFEYRAFGDSCGASCYEANLNRLAQDGWRFAGGVGPAVVMERAK